MTSTRAPLPRTPNFARVQELFAGAKEAVGRAMVTASLGGDHTAMSRQAAMALRSAADELDPQPAGEVARG